MIKQKSQVLFFLFLWLSWPLLGQFNQGQQPDRLVFDRGMELVNLEKYAAARSLFEEYLAENPLGDNAAEARFWIAALSLKSGHEDGVSLANKLATDGAFLNRNQLLAREIGFYHFDQKDYASAIESLERLSGKPSDEERFKLGYAYYKTENNKKAYPLFRTIADQESTYKYDAAYYAGSLAFNTQDYANAKRYLRIAGENKSYQTVVQPMLATVYYKEGDLTGLYELAESTSQRTANAAQIFWLAGEAKFSEEKYAEAVAYYEKGLAIKKSADDAILYRLGFSYYQLEQDENAIDNLKKVAVRDDQTGQHASYYLGLLYFRQNNLANASRSFYAASRMDFVPSLKQKALFQYGKVSYAAGNFEETIESFQQYIEQYKSEPEAEEAREIVSKAFLQTSNYDLAINYIEGLSAKNTSIRETYQRVTFLKGSQLFNQSRFSDAITYFNKSIQFPINRELEDAAYYWKGEAYAIARKYDQAIDAFNMVLKAGARSGFDYKVQYSLGYAYYNQKAYDKAIPYFTRYLQKNDKVAVNSATITDARLRLADCYYTQKKFDTALSYYQQVANSDFALRDYALYQAGMAAFLKPDYEMAERSFSSLISRFPGSTYVDDALFQRAQIAFENGVYREAIDGFTQLIDQYGTSNLLPFAHVRRAVSNFNLKSYGPAKEDYIKVITDYPSHSMANSAILGLQEVMTLEGSTEDFDQYLSMYRQANPESTNLESVDFESARSTYFNQRYQVAIQKFESFIESYPESSYLDDAYYYLADAHFRLEQNDQALSYYQFIIEDPGSTYYLRALNRAATLALESARFDQAIALFKDQQRAARSKRDVVDALTGQMVAYYGLEQYDSAFYYADQVLIEAGGSFNAQGRAQLYLGKSAYAMGKLDEAVDYFINASNGSRDQTGAEAQYMMAQIFYEQGNHKQSVQTLYDLNKNYAAFEKWLGMSFLLIADNFMAMDEGFQAKATLNSLIEKSPLEDIKQQAREKLKQLEAAEMQEIKEDTITQKTDSIR